MLGRQLDKLIAEKFLGHDVVVTTTKFYEIYTIEAPHYDDYCGSLELANSVPSYSQDPQEALALLDILALNGTIYVRGIKAGQEWGIEYVEGDGAVRAYASSFSIPAAICALIYDLLQQKGEINATL
jgi:hypothetical protein